MSKGSTHPWGGGPFAQGNWEYPFVGKGGGGGGTPAAIPVGHGHGHGGHGGGHHGGGGFRHWGGGPRGRWWGPGPWAYDVPIPSYGIDIDELLAASEDEERLKKKDTQALAKAIVKQLKAGQATVGGDLDLLDGQILGEVPAGIFDFGISSIFNTAGNLAQTGVSIWQAEEEKKKKTEAQGKAAQDEQRKIAAAIAADAAATQAAARAAWTSGAKLPSAAVDASAAAQAAATQARAAAGLSQEANDRRLEAANKAWAAATAVAQKNPKDPYNQALLTAWQQMVNKIQNAQITGTPGPAADGKASQPSGWDSGWLSGKTGPVPNKVIAGGGVVLAGVIVLKALLR